MALDFDGTNDYVTFGAAAGLNVHHFTLETWFRRDGAGVGMQHRHRRHRHAIPLVTKGRAEAERRPTSNMNYFLGIDATTASSWPTSRTTRPVSTTRSPASPRSDQRRLAPRRGDL